MWNVEQVRGTNNWFSRENTSGPLTNGILSRYKRSKVSLRRGYKVVAVFQRHHCTSSPIHGEIFAINHLYHSFHGNWLFYCHVGYRPLVGNFWSNSVLVSKLNPAARCKFGPFYLCHDQRRWKLLLPSNYRHVLWDKWCVKWGERWSFLLPIVCTKFASKSTPLFAVWQVYSRAWPSLLLRWHVYWSRKRAILCCLRFLCVHHVRLCCRYKPYLSAPNNWPFYSVKFWSSVQDSSTVDSV